MAQHFVAILAAEPDGHVAKFAHFPTLALAQAHVDRFVSAYPDAFATDTPGLPWARWKIDFITNTILGFPVEVPVVVELPVILALRDLADRLGPQAVADIEVHLGPRP